MAVQTTEEFKNGGATSYAITIEYLKTSDIKVRIDGALQTYVASSPSTGEYTVSGTTVTLGATAAAGTGNVHIYRETDVDTAAAVFAVGSAIRAADLNALHDMARMGVAEARSKVITADIKEGQVTSTEILDGTIVDADVSGSAAIANTKLATGLLPSGITVNSANIVNGSIVNEDVSNSANIDGSKLATSSIPVDRMGSGTLPSHTKVVSANIEDGTIVDADISTGTLDNRYYTETELDPSAVAGANVLDARYYTETEADARFYNLASAEEIQSGESWVAADNKVATTAAIDARIVDLVDDVGGFVPILNELGFPTTNPDVNNGAGTLISIKEISVSRTPSSGTVTIANGAGTGNTVSIIGCGTTVLPAGYGVIVETTGTLHAYTFHRLAPKATEVTTVSGIAPNVTTVAGISSDVTTVANISSDVTAVAGNNANVTAVAGNATNINAVQANATNINAVNSNKTNIDTVAGSISNVNTVSGSIASVNNASANLTSINNYGDQYQVATSNPSTDGGGNALAVGDLFFNSTANELKVYNGTAWQAGVTTTGNFALVTGNNFTGDNVYVDNAKARFGTGQDLSIYHTNAESLIEDTGTGGLTIKADPHIKLQQAGTNDDFITCTGSGSVSLFHDGASKLSTTSAGASVTGNITVSAGASVTGNITVSGTVDGRDVATDGTKLDGIETAATADQTAAEIRTLVESATDSNVFTDADHTKLNGIEASATADQTDAEIRTAVENATDSNVFTDADHTKLNAIEASATADQTASEIVALVADQTIAPSEIDMEDNEKIKLGTGDDLEIYHSGSHSVIRTTTGSTGNLNIRSDNDILIGTLTDGNNFITCTEGAQVELHHNYSKKFETKSDGVEVTGNIYATGNIGRDSNDYILFTDNNQMDVYINGNNEFRFEADGDFHADGDITAFSTTTASDARLKSDIHTINDALGIVGKLRGVSYKWLRDGKSDIGVIAQEVEEVIPEIVKTKKMPGLDGLEEVKTVDYGKMVGVLINAVNELKKEIEELKNAKTTG